MEQTLVSVAPHEKVIDHAGFYKRWLNRALAYDLEGLTAENIVDRYLSEYVVLDVVNEGNAHQVGVACIEIVPVNTNTGEVKYLHVVALAGEDIHSWVEDFVSVLKKIAKEQGCVGVTLKGREGWRKLLKGLGFRHLFSVLRADV